MNDRRLPLQPDELLRRWGTQVVPVDTAERTELRRTRVVSVLSRSIREGAARKYQVGRWRWVGGLGLAASVALGVGLLTRQRTAPPVNPMLTMVAEVQGAVVVTEAGQTSVLSRHGSRLTLHALGEIETAPDAQAELLSPRSVVHLSPASKLTVPPASNTEERYRLALGHVDVSVDRHSKLSRSVVVETPNAEVVVHGTIFAVDVSSRAQHTVTKVSVTRGSVWVLANGVQVAVLGPGQRWASDGSDDVGAPPTDSAAATQEPRLVSNSNPNSNPNPNPNAAARVSAPSVAQDTPRPGVAKSTLAERERLFQDAIDARNRGDDARAAELFTRLVVRYPNYEEAEVQLFRAQRRLGQMTAAAAGARRYLAEHPKGFARDEARSLALSTAPVSSH